MKKWTKTITMVVLSVVILGGCRSGDQGSKSKDKGEKEQVVTALPSSFEEAKTKAKGQTVTFYGFGGSEKANLWIDQEITPKMKEAYDVTVKRVPMDIKDILNKLMTEKEAKAKKGDIDVIWINGENFYTAKKAELLAGPLTELVPNYKALMATNSHDNNYDFGVEIEGYELPYGTAQLVLAGDTKNFPNGFPSSTEKLLAYAKENPGKLTYTAPPEFTGSAFIRNVICDIIGFDALDKAPADKEKLTEVIQPGLDYLNGLKPYLWEKGTTYPTTTAELDDMFAANQIHMTYSYSQMHVAEKRHDKSFKESVESFLFDKGTITNQNYLALADNSDAKDAGVLLINEMIGEDSQLKKAEAKYGYSIPPFSAEKMAKASQDKLNKIYENKGVLPLADLQAKQIPEIGAEKITMIEEIWKEQVLAK